LKNRSGLALALQRQRPDIVVGFGIQFTIDQGFSVWGKRKRPLKILAGREAFFRALPSADLQ
jgi:hypothetical protein